MKKTTAKKKRFLRARNRYEMKRRSPEWKRRKLLNRLEYRQNFIRRKKREKKPFIQMEAPSDFSVIANTDQVLAYFDKAEKIMRGGDNINFDISNVEMLTPPTVALLIASINDIDFTHGGIVAGNAPNNTSLKKLFTESGFYNFVKAPGQYSQNSGNLLHKEVNRIVVPEIAASASVRGIKHTFNRTNQLIQENLHEVLVECMSNTNNHANLKIKGKCNWWLFVCTDPNSETTSYTFLDLGVGIFKSASVQNWFKKITKGTKLYPNIRIVEDLLAGKIKSRAKIDKDIRGKGIPQIVENSSSACYKSFYIISNDVKIDLKTKKAEQLGQSLHGTLLYWELQNA